MPNEIPRTSSTTLPLPQNADSIQTESGAEENGRCDEEAVKADYIRDPMRIRSRGK